MNKEQAIQAAYGEHWDKVKNFVDGNGWCLPRKDVSGPVMSMGVTNITWDESYGKWRPKQLSGIEDNNGWIPGLPPDDAKKTWVFTKRQSVMCVYPADINFMSLAVTHWQPLEKPNPPIYDSE